MHEPGSGRLMPCRSWSIRSATCADIGQGTGLVVSTMKAASRRLSPPTPRGSSPHRPMRTRHPATVESTVTLSC